MATRNLAPVPDAWLASLDAYEVDELSAGRSVRAIANRRASIKQLARWLESEYSISSPEQVTTLHLTKWMIRQHKERSGSGVKTHYNDLKSYFGWLAATEGLESPLKPIRRPKGGDEAVTPVLTTEEIQKLLAACGGKDYLAARDTALIICALETGLRCEELVLLSISDVRLREHELVVRRGKLGKRREAVFGTATEAALRRLLRAHPCKDAEDSPLFATSNGHRLVTCSVRAMLRRRGAAAGIDDLRTHIFRHTWAHMNQAAGMAEHDLMVLGGWSSTRELARYGKAMAAQRAKAAGKARPVLELIKAAS